MDKAKKAFNCPQCGNPIRPTDNFCESCGMKIRGKCPVCDAKIKTGSMICANCGADFRVKAQARSYSRPIPQSVINTINKRTIQKQHGNGGFLSAFLIVAILAIIGFGVYYLDFGSLQAVSDTPATSLERKITCPHCQGFGYTVRPSFKGASDKVRIACRFCEGRGYRMITIPAGGELCPTCGGMGCVLREKMRDVITQCPRCRGDGYVVRK